MLIGQQDVLNARLAASRIQYLRMPGEDKPEPLDRMVERALGALRFAKNATLNYETATEYTMAREQEIEANRRKEDTEGNIPQEVEREAEQIPATGVKRVVGNNDLFPIGAKIWRVPWTKPVQDDRAENEQQLRRWGRL